MPASNLPPGVSVGMINRMFDEGPCAICGYGTDDCVCPECPVCGAQGDTVCYHEHKLALTREQVIAHYKLKTEEAKQAYYEIHMMALQLEAENDWDAADYQHILRER